MYNDNPDRQISEFDRLVGSLSQVPPPDVVKSKASTFRAELPLIGLHRSYIVQTYRHRELGDTIFLETVGGEGSIRIAIPPQVADTIARQRESLSKQLRSKLSKQSMQDRMARGEWKGFAKKAVGE